MKIKTVPSSAELTTLPRTKLLVRSAESGGIQDYCDAIVLEDHLGRFQILSALEVKEGLGKTYYLREKEKTEPSEVSLKLVYAIQNFGYSSVLGYLYVGEFVK